MRISHDPNDLAISDDLAISTLWEIAALGEGLELKSVLIRQDMLGLTQGLW